jgi:cystathionine beta-lyase
VRNGVTGLEKEHIGYENGVLGGLVSALRALLPDGGKVLLHRPTYVGFTGSVTNAGYEIVHSDLTQDEDGTWRMDYEDMDRKIRENDIKVCIFCNPHNPCGRVWTKEEIESAAAVYEKNGCTVISDEIWSDLILGDNHFTPFQTVSEWTKENTVALYAPSKTFNLAGLQTAFVIIPNDEIRAKFDQGQAANRIINMNWFGQVALETAYNRCENYVDGLRDYVNANMDYMVDYVRKNLPMLKLRKSEGTYMVWVDFRGSGMTTEEIEYFIAHKAHIGVDMGTWFGPGGEGWLRFNLACPRCLLDKALEMLTNALNSL